MGNSPRLSLSQTMSPVQGSTSYSASSGDNIHTISSISFIIEFAFLFSSKIPSEPINTSSWDHLEGLPFADPDFATPAQIDIILGADIYGHLLRDELRKGPSNAPVAQHTTLGSGLRRTFRHRLTRGSTQMNKRAKSTFAQLTLVIQLDAILSGCRSGLISDAWGILARLRSNPCADTPERAADKAKQLAQLLIAGGFPLQKWSTNDLTILANIHESSQLDFSNREFNAEARTLGLIWNPNSDTFRFKLFDPLGWLSPITLVGKMLIQQLWKDQIEWDDPVPAAISQKWVSFADNLTTVESYSIPRSLFQMQNGTTSLEPIIQPTAHPGDFCHFNFSIMSSGGTDLPG
ncbi:hypothetical protein DMN91_008905 [Ooceraea biroi]|uniref:Peptidase aspartic putative domain-containing protein n=1 Tax=Ooceraea biroi TaxID=2015173 RepID=A0A3L8DF56_OOCBI|nr:hypothetical protein DMN91_008905 [Ooceraea biroi]